MLVVLPTYKRIELLPIVIESILTSQVDSIPEQLRLIISNNYYPHKEKIEDILMNLRSKFSYSINWIIITLHNVPTIPAVDNWYRVILNHAIENEVVFLHGDDDILHPNFLQQRYLIVKETKADLLLSKVYSGLTYVNETKVHLMRDYFSIPHSQKHEILDEGNYNNFGNVFIGSHTYCYTSSLKKSILDVFEWTEEQKFVDYDTRNIMFPYYLLLSCFKNRLKVFGVDFIGCIRGTSLHEKLNARFNSSFGWNSGYISLLMLDLLNRDDNNFNQTKAYITQDVRTWYFTMFLDNRVNKTVLKTLLVRNLITLNLKDYFINFRVIFRQYFKLKSIKIRLDVFMNRNIYDIKILTNK